MADHYLTLSLNGENQTGIINRCEIRKAFGVHSLVIIDIRVGAIFGQGTATVLWPEWTPARLDFGRRFDLVVPWYGYVHHHVVLADMTAITGTIIRYVLVGTSLPMNNEQTRSWRGVTASSLARQVFREHGLRNIVSTHPRILPYWAQPGISDFALLQGLSEETGYRLFIDGPTAQFFNPRTLLSSPQSSNTPNYRLDRGRGGATSLLNFEAMTGRMVPRLAGQTRQSVIFGVDKRSSRTLHATATPVAGGQQKVLSTRAVDDFAVAQSLTDAQTLAQQGWITARAEVIGDASLNPGGIVRVGGTAISTDNAGVWLIRGVTHLFDVNIPLTKNRFVSSLELERDQIYGATFDKVASVSNTTDATYATMRGGQLWVAQFMEDIRVK